MISRRAFVQVAALGGLALAARRFGVSDGRQNVLLILADSMNDWVSVLGGYPGVQTPNIDRLAAQGVTFTNAHAAGTHPNAARTSLFTGIAPYRSGIYGGDAIYRDTLPTINTLPQRFMTARYRVIGAGRLFQRPDRWSWQARPFVPFNNRFVETSLAGVGSGPNFDWGEIDVAEADLHDFQVTEWAIDNITSLTTPFFMGVGLSETRHPWYLPPDLYRRVDPATVRLPDERSGLLPPEAQQMVDFNNRHRLVRERGQWAQAVAAYLACMMHLDDMVGRLLDALEASGKADKTVVVFTSTHGFHLGDKRFWLFDSLWERGTRVPLIIRVPQGDGQPMRNAGMTSRRAVSTLDIYPTLNDLFGFAPLHTMDGRSLLPLLEDPSTAWDFPVISSNSQGAFAVRSNRWRYIRYPQGGEELYEMIGDRRELINLADSGAHRPIKAELAAALPLNPADALVPSV